jgi:DNA-binding MarR family transcriptional regulator
MKNYTRLLSQKDISPLGKLIIMDIIEYPSIMTYDKTSQQIANTLGSKRKTVLNELECLIEMGLITCKVEPRRRITKITKLTKELTND